MSDKPTTLPPHHNQQPGLEAEMTPQPECSRPGYKSGGKLWGKVGLITGGDSGIGRAVAQQLAAKKIRINAGAPGPIWTPLIPASFPADKVASFGKYTTMKRPGQPSEVAPAYVFLASDDSTYFTGQALHPNGGKTVNT